MNAKKYSGYIVHRYITRWFARLFIALLTAITPEILFCEFAMMP